MSDNDKGHDNLPEPKKSKVLFAEPWPEKLLRWEHHSNIVLMILAVLFIGAWAVPILVPTMAHQMALVLDSANILIWVVFIIDFVVRLRLAGAGRRWEFVRTHPVDCIMVLIPALRPLMLLRLVLLMAEISHRGAAATLPARTGIYVSGFSVLILFVSSLLILTAERGHPGSTIEDFWDALWWAVVTTTTVGYGDYTPVTPNGRIVASCLMFIAIGLFGVVSGSMASWFVNRTKTLGQTDIDPQVAQIDEIRDDMAIKLRELEQKLDLLIDAQSRKEQLGLLEIAPDVRCGPCGALPQLSSINQVGSRDQGFSLSSTSRLKYNCRVIYILLFK